MKKMPSFNETSIRRAARLLVVSLTSSSLTVAQAAVSLGTAPPVTKQTPEPVPNIILTLDDSGSMDWALDSNRNRKPGEVSRMDVLKQAATAAFSVYDDGKFRLAYQSINGARSASGFSAGGFTTSEHRNLMKPFEGQHRRDFFNWLNTLPPSGYTPLRRSVISAGAYTMGYLSGRSMVGPAHTYQYAGKKFRYDPLNGLDCRRSIHILMTDGEWNGSIPGNTGGVLKLSDSSSVAVNIPTPQYGSLGPKTSVTQYDSSSANTYSGHLYQDVTSDTLADLTFNFWATDLRSDLDNNVRPNISQKGDQRFSYGSRSKIVPEWWNPKNNPANWQNLQTYTIGFGPVARLNELRKPSGGGYESDPEKYMYTGRFFGEKITGVTPWLPASSNHPNNRYDLWHAAYNGRGKFYAASDSQALKKAFEDILAAATTPAKGGAPVSAGAASSRLTAGTMAYVAGYQVDDGVWKGSLIYQTVGEFGKEGSKTLVVADVPAEKNRNILTWRDNVGGIPFQWQDLSAGLSDDTNPRLSDLNLGKDEKMLKALRSKPLGDIVHSSVALVGRPSNASFDTSYRHFSGAIASRDHMVYVGANDGMLHGFDAGRSTAAKPGTGVEKLAYVPRGLVRDLHAYLDDEYEHRYWVDGSPFTGDMQIVSQSSESGKDRYNGWRTVLAGTLGAGGKGYYVLDVTNPANFSEKNAKGLVLVDNTFAANDDKADPDLGHQMHEPVEDASSLTKSAQIVQVNLNSVLNPGKKQWAIIMGNGINSANGKPVLLIQTLEGNRKTLHKIDACSISSTNDNAAQCEAMPVSSVGTNGLMAPRPVDMNGDGTADVVYAGDFQGNLWKFDISSSNAKDWKVGLGGKPLFTAKGLPTKSSNNPATAYRQTITAAPVVEPHPKGGFMVAFGTGRNINLGDQRDHEAEKMAIYGRRLNTFYGIHDKQKFAVDRNVVTLDPDTAAPVDSTVQAGTGSRFAALVQRLGGELGQPDNDNIRQGGTDQDTKLIVNQGWYWDMPSIQFDNATKVLQNPWRLRDNVVTFFSVNVSKESGSEEEDKQAKAEEVCAAETEHTPSALQLNYFNLFNGVNPNVAIYSDSTVINANSDGKYGNVLEIGGSGSVGIKGSNASKSGGKLLRPDFQLPPGKFTGWRIVR